MGIAYLEFLRRARGLGSLRRRAQTIARRYGLTSSRMMEAIDALVSELEQYECRATFPVTAVALARNPAPIRYLRERGAEIAVHGWNHVDLERYSLEQLREYLSRALELFERQGIPVWGFRSPYLRHNGAIRQAAEEAGFRYVSNQPVLWDTIELSGYSRERLQAYQQAIDFYGPKVSAEHLSLPVMQGRIVEIPVSLPDDEMLVERLGAGSAQIAEVWTRILHQTYARGELFVLQLHPERAEVCAPALGRVLSEARALNPPVWIASLHEVAEWWRQRQIESGRAPFWPGNARSALSITGDIDALTLWDYGARFIGR